MPNLVADANHSSDSKISVNVGNLHSPPSLQRGTSENGLHSSQRQWRRSDLIIKIKKYIDQLDAGSNLFFNFPDDAAHEGTTTRIYKEIAITRERVGLFAEIVNH